MGTINGLDTKGMVNAENIGAEGVLQQTMEECGELIQAICKYNRARGTGQFTEVTEDEAIYKLTEELTDVQICLEYVRHMLEIDNREMYRKKIDKVYYRYLDLECDTCRENGGGDACAECVYRH